MRKKTIPIIAGVITIVVIAVVVSFYISQKTNSEIKPQWIVSGPFAISKPQYKIGENVFMTVNNLQPNEVGNIIIITPQNKTWVTIPFNGTLKDHFNYYFKPDTSKAAKISSIEELVGTWLVIFEGVRYQPLSFEVINEYLPGFTPDEETQVEKLMKPSINSTG